MLTGIFALSGAVIASLLQILNTRLNQSYDLQSKLELEKLRIESEKSKKRSDLIQEKLERSLIILSELSREFSLTCLTIDWSAKMLPLEYHNKYRELCTKADELKMIVNLYVPSTIESVEELIGLMNCYWGYFHIVLTIEAKGEKVDHTTPSYLEAVKYSQMIPSKAYAIEQKIGEMAC